MDGILVDFISALLLVDKEILMEYKGHEDDIDRLFSLMKPMPGAIEAINFLFQYFDTYILTTAPWNNPSAWRDKLLWIKRYLPEVGHKRLIISHNKHLCQGDYLIDDRIRHGVDRFNGEHIHFGKGIFKDWKSVLKYLCQKEGIPKPDFSL